MASEVHFVPLSLTMFFERYCFLEFYFLLWDCNEIKLFEQTVTFGIMCVDIEIEGQTASHPERVVQ